MDIFNRPHLYDLSHIRNKKLDLSIDSKHLTFPNSLFLYTLYRDMSSRLKLPWHRKNVTTYQWDDSVYMPYYKWSTHGVSQSRKKFHSRAVRNYFLEHTHERISHLIRWMTDAREENKSPKRDARIQYKELCKDMLIEIYTSRTWNNFEVSNPILYYLEHESPHSEEIKPLLSKAYNITKCIISMKKPYRSFKRFRKESNMNYLPAYSMSDHPKFMRREFELTSYISPETLLMLIYQTVPLINKRTDIKTLSEAEEDTKHIYIPRDPTKIFIPKNKLEQIPLRINRENAVDMVAQKIIQENKLS